MCWQMALVLIGDDRMNASDLYSGKCSCFVLTGHYTTYPPSIQSSRLEGVAWIRAFENLQTPSDQPNSRSSHCVLERLALMADKFQSEPRGRRVSLAKDPGLMTASHTEYKEPIEELDTEFKRKFPPDPLGKELDDGARVWKVYRDEATAYDTTMLDGWSQTLDILLIFAGLFSAVATAFVIESYQLLGPDKDAYILTALYIIASASNSSTPLLLPPPPPFDTNVSSLSRWINGLWFTSILLSLSVALLSILVKQWIGEYRMARTMRHYNSSRAYERTDLVEDVGFVQPPEIRINVAASTHNMRCTTTTLAAHLDQKIISLQRDAGTAQISTRLDLLCDQLDASALHWLVLSVSDSDAVAVGLQAFSGLDPDSRLADELRKDPSLLGFTASQAVVRSTSSSNNDVEAARIVRSMLAVNATVINALTLLQFWGAKES
ncbi:hypothetical protein EXIGLDRAFT_746826 [Exidia glandulosa HHB12029]|uniref:DUF6535 domain-containing protein n=1 Tax=Exidia glandulosa HHB12029 TaxID=1314781 RepID=A0A165LM03_EXIGL|nr:hypothetical protein EXIGLDRAFT_746826 [Exidia glandulosa HHB12029]